MRCPARAQPSARRRPTLAATPGSCCAFIEPDTAAEQAAWRAAMPDQYDTVSPIHRPRELARALGAMAAEQIGPRGRTARLRSAVDGRGFRASHRSQTVYHGPVVYADDPCRRLENASSVLEYAVLLVFLKPAARRPQREYRFAVWAEKESREECVDLQVSAALLDAMQKPPPAGVGFLPADADETAAVEEVDNRGTDDARVIRDVVNPVVRTCSNDRASGAADARCPSALFGFPSRPSPESRRHSVLGFRPRLDRFAGSVGRLVVLGSSGPGDPV